MKVAIIGAGLSGLTAAHALSDKVDVTIFEKSKGFGGRMATRRSDAFCFDHGAQYFTIKTSRFQSFLSPYIKKGVVREWDAKIVSFDAKNDYKLRGRPDPIYVASPNMNALGKALAEELNVKRNTHISRIEGERANWSLIDHEGTRHGVFDWVLVSAPAPQTLNLMPEFFTEYEPIKSAEMLGCFTLMAGFDDPLALSFDAAFVDDSAVGFIANNSSKPGREMTMAKTALVVQSNNHWASEHIEDDLLAVQTIIAQETARITGIEVANASHLSFHRWRYANVATAVGKPFLLDETNQLACFGDWCIKGRVESAFESGWSLGCEIKALV